MYMLPHRARRVTERFNENEIDVNNLPVSDPAEHL